MNLCGCSVVVLTQRVNNKDLSLYLSMKVVMRTDVVGIEIILMKSWCSVCSVYEPCVLMHGVVHVRGTDVHAAHRAARGRRIPSCRSWRSWGWTLAAGWSDAPSHRTDRTLPWRCCDPNTSHAFATSPAGSGTRPEKQWDKRHKRSKLDLEKHSD